MPEVLKKGRFESFIYKGTSSLAKDIARVEMFSDKYGLRSEHLTPFLWNTALLSDTSFYNTAKGECSKLPNLKRLSIPPAFRTNGSSGSPIR